MLKNMLIDVYKRQTPFILKDRKPSVLKFPIKLGSVTISGLTPVSNKKLYGPFPLIKIGITMRFLTLIKVMTLSLIHI